MTDTNPGWEPVISCCGHTGLERFSCGCRKLKATLTQQMLP